MSSRAGDFIISVLAGIATYVILSFTGDTFTSLPEISTYSLPFQLNKHFLAMSSLVFLLILTSGVNQDNASDFIIGALLIVPLISIPISYVISIFTNIPFATVAYAVVFIGITFFILVATFEPD